jgi:hypothetical protein
VAERVGDGLDPVRERQLADDVARDLGVAGAERRQLATIDRQDRVVLGAIWETDLPAHAAPRSR